SASGYPDWPMGKSRRVVAIPDCIAVETRPSYRRDVVVEVWTGELQVEGLDMARIHRGSLRVMMGAAVIRSPAGSGYARFELSTGQHEVEVYVAPKRKPADYVFFLIDPLRSAQPGSPLTIA
ncbi:MAG: hypothetical protein KGJ86_12285, partial [Chloroflexota bacterium]|nr:hypothetical protein [Chloroflexota bacterium]